MADDNLREQMHEVLAESIADVPHDIDRHVDEVLAVVEDEAIDRMAAKLIEETNLRSMDFRNGMAMDIEPARALAANFVGAARAMLGEAPNYSETPVEMGFRLAGQVERFAFVVQRVAPGKLTPHEARQAAETAAKLALAALEGAETSCRYHGETPPEAPGWHGGCESCRQPTRVREALAAIRALTPTGEG